MTRSDIVTRAAEGAAAGVASTFVLNWVREFDQRQVPSSKPPIRQEPGEFMVERAESLLPASTRAQVPDSVESAAARSLAIGYGATSGALYGLVRPDGGDPIMTGAALGVVTWAVGYLGWLPATGLMPPVTEQRGVQVAMPLAEHVLFGVAVALAYTALRRLHPA
jgi:hypothetical protein